MADPNPLENQLIEAALQGNDAAFSELISPYREKIFRLCIGIVRDQEIAEEVVQDAFLHAYQHLKEFRHESKFYTWLYSIAKNLSLNALKKRKKQMSREKRIIDPDQQRISKRISKLTKDSKIEEAELLQNIQQRLEGLKESHRTVFEMFILQGKKHKEIAQILQIPQGTVRSRLFYARKWLKQI